VTHGMLAHSTRHVTFYHKDTGLLNGLSVMVSDDSAVALNTPKDHVAIDNPLEGPLDHLSQRVDLTGEKPVVVDYQPPQPSPDHEWNAEAKRWRLKPGAADRQARRLAALAEIARLEATQPRAVREALCGDTAALQRLRTIDEAITKLRTEL
jgi:hypothetical protein